MFELKVHYVMFGKKKIKLNNQTLFVLMTE